MKKIRRNFVAAKRIVLSNPALGAVIACGDPPTANGIGTSPIIWPIDPLPMKE